MIRTIAPRRVLVFLAACLALLLAAHLGVMFAQHVLGFSYLFGLIALFDMNSEQNLPTLFSSMLLLACGLLLFVSGRLAARMRPAWYALAAAFALLAISETAELHEPLLFVMRGKVSPRTADLAANLPLRFADMVPLLVVLGAVVMAVAVAFLRQLDTRARWLFLVAAALYLGGAVGVDEITAASAHGPTAPLWLQLVSTTVEEVLEVGGASLFLYGLLDRLARLYPGIGMRLGA